MIPPEMATLRDFLRWGVSRFNEAGLCFGHGMQDAFDEAAYLLLHCLHLPLDRLDPFMDAALTESERQRVADLFERRIAERIPSAYLTHEAWLGDFRFYVDERVIVPRSHIAGLLQDNSLTPWVGDAERVGRALDLCTGSGCLAIMLAHAFPNAHIDAVDISADALAVAARNVSDYRLENRIDLLRSDLFDGLSGRRYGIIVSNPPYVTGESMEILPPEYRHEPSLALASGQDGLDAVRGILSGACDHLLDGGALCVEVGGNRALVENAFPELDFTWFASQNEDGMVFLLLKEQIRGRS